MKKLLILLSVILLCTSNAFSQQLPRIAVFVAVNESDDAEMSATKRILGTRLVEAIARSELFTAVERSERFLAEIRRVHGIHAGGQIRDDQIVRQARVSGEQYIIVADVTRLRGEDFVEARMIDVESGNILGVPASSDIVIRRMSDLIGISDQISTRLISRTPQYIAEQRRREDKLRRTPFLDRETFDFGAIPLLRGSATATFTVRNPTDSSLRITTVTSNSRSLVPEWTRTAIPSGGTGTITARFSTSGRQGTNINHRLIATLSNGEELIMTVTGRVE